MGPENEIERQAAEWAARTEGETLSERDQAAFEAWLAADIRHVGAYSMATAALAQLDRIRVAGMPAELSPPEASSRRRFLWAGSLAASIAVLAVAGTMSWDWLHERSYSTRLGETQVVSLSDGSAITLNTDSRIVVRYSDSRREVRLVRGEALCDVAKNKARPFIVVVNDLNVRAVGTSFVVRALAGQPVAVLVREGTVEIKRPATPVATPVLLHAGERALAPADAPISVTQVSADQMANELAWTGGRVAFEDVSLADAAREFARYSQTHIVINDSATARRTVTGLYVANDPVGFSKAVATSLDLNVEVGQDEVRLTSKHR